MSIVSSDVATSFDEQIGEEVCTLKMDTVELSASPSLFSGPLSGAQKRRLFKRFVSRVLLEVSAYCNRRCVFCPNKTGLRLSQQQAQKTMADTLLKDVLKSLQAINYDRNIVLHLYNEPMADPALAAKVEVITSALPLASVWFNTNGDYLTRERLEDLARARLTKLNVSLYGPRQGEYDLDYLERAFDRVFSVVGVQGEIEAPSRFDRRARLTYEYNGWKIPITVFATDFNVVGYDRASAIAAPHPVRRTTPCASVFSEFNIAWDGVVVPCCNVHPHEPDHEAYRIGRVVEGEHIFDIYHGEVLRKWRRNLALFDQHQSPCDSCSRYEYQGLEQTLTASRSNESFRKMMNGDEELSPVHNPNLG